MMAKEPPPLLFPPSYISLSLFSLSYNIILMRKCVSMTTFKSNVEESSLQSTKKVAWTTKPLALSKNYS